MGGGGVPAHADDHGVLCGEFVVQPGIGQGLPGAAGGAVLRVEIQHDPPAEEIGQGDGIAVLVRQGKRGGFHSGFQHKGASFKCVFSSIPRSGAAVKSEEENESGKRMRHGESRIFRFYELKKHFRQATGRQKAEGLRAASKQQSTSRDAFPWRGRCPGGADEVEGRRVPQQRGYDTKKLK